MYRKRKTLQELTIRDNFMFGAVMSEEENCRRFLELALEISIARVEIIKDNVEIQVEKEREIGKRSRYYHSQMDMEMLVSGKNYTELAQKIWEETGL